MSRSDSLGRISQGKFEILGKGAVGGMGEVYAVRHRLLGELRAVKIMRAASASDPQLRERFMQEARTAARLHHPNLVQLYDLAFHEDGTAYMVLEWIEGLDLAKLLKEYGPPPLAATLDMAGQALDALGYLHDEGIVHRDVSTDNLMVAEAPGGGFRVKVIDLGIAKSIKHDSGLTRRGLFVGKLHYAAPETLTPGRRLPEVLSLDDVTTDLDLTPNRGDALSIRGLAREVALLTRQAVVRPSYAPIAATTDAAFPVAIENFDGCPRYLGRVISGVDVTRPVPWWLRERLRRSGLRSIDPVVDVT